MKAITTHLRRVSVIAITAAAVATGWTGNKLYLLAADPPDLLLGQECLPAIGVEGKETGSRRERGRTYLGRRLQLDLSRRNA